MESSRVAFVLRVVLGVVVAKVFMFALLIQEKRSPIRLNWLPKTNSLLGGGHSVGNSQVMNYEGRFELSYLFENNIIYHFGKLFIVSVMGSPRKQLHSRTDNRKSDHNCSDTFHHSGHHSTTDMCRSTYSEDVCCTCSTSENTMDGSRNQNTEESCVNR